MAKLVQEGSASVAVGKAEAIPQAKALLVHHFGFSAEEDLRGGLIASDCLRQMLDEEPRGRALIQPGTPDQSQARITVTAR